MKYERKDNGLMVPEWTGSPLTSDSALPPMAGGDFATVAAIYQAASSAGAAIATTTVETDLFDSDPIFPANYFYPGRTIYFHLAGGYQTTGTPTLTFRVRGGTGGVGGTLFQTSGVLTTASGVATDQVWILDYWLQCHTTGSSGTATGWGKLHAFSSSGTVHAAIGIPATATGTVITLNSTITQTIAITVQWNTSSGSDTIQRDSYFVTALN